MWLVILEILKIIGLILLALVSLVLVLLLVVLFVPVRYRLFGYKEDSYSVNASFSWLLFILHGRAQYSGELTYSVKALFFTLAPKKEKEPRKRKDKKQSDAANASDGSDESEVIVSEDTGADEIIDKEIITQETTADETAADEITTDETIADETKAEATKADATKVKKTISKEKKFVNPLEFCKAKLEKLQYTIKSIYAKIVAKGEWLREKIDFLNETRTKEALLLVFNSVKRLLAHILPRKGKGDIYFGFSDPSLTGKTVAVYSILYPVIGKVVHIYPDFNNETFHGRFDMRGRVRVFTVLLILVKLYFNKDFRYLKNNLVD